MQGAAENAAPAPGGRRVGAPREVRQWALLLVEFRSAAAA
jgi:hypothetical protein